MFRLWTMGMDVVGLDVGLPYEMVLVPSPNRPTTGGSMKLICIECLAEFEDTQKEVVEKGERVMKPLTAKEQAYLHTTRSVTKDSPVRVPMKRHVVFPKTGRGA